MQQKVVTSEIFRDKKDGYAESLNQPFANSRIGKSIFPSMYSLSLFKKKKKKSGSNHCGAAETNPTSIHEDVGLVPGLT